MLNNSYNKQRMYQELIVFVLGLIFLTTLHISRWHISVPWRLWQHDHLEGWFCQNIQGLYQFSLGLLLNHLVFKSLFWTTLKIIVLIYFSSVVRHSTRSLLSVLCADFMIILHLLIRFVISLCDRFALNYSLIHPTTLKRQNDGD